jgi:hypothetical protein
VPHDGKMGKQPNFLVEIFPAADIEKNRVASPFFVLPISKVPFLTLLKILFHAVGEMNTRLASSVRKA